MRGNPCAFRARVPTYGTDILDAYPYVGSCGPQMGSAGADRSDLCAAFSAMYIALSAGCDWADAAELMRRVRVIDPSVRAVLRSRYTIRRFFWTYGAILCAALLV